MARSFVDPKTRQATAFYAALGIAVWDVYRQGLHPINAVFLGAMAGVGVAGAMAVLWGRPPDDTK